jgi:uncharacterized protein (AIM24 family)
MPTYTLINTKLLSVNLNGEEVLAKKGAMIAYTGKITFQGALLSGGNIQELAMRQVTGEGWRLMKTRGSGEVLYGHHGYFVTILPVRGQTLYVESDNVLVFDNRLRPSTMFLGNQGIQGIARGMTSGQGLFTTTFDGQGEVAVTSSGDLIELTVSPGKAVFVDPQAYIAHSGQLTSKVHTDLGWKNLIGQGSGEGLQLKFEGSGTIYIQADER